MGLDGSPGLPAPVSELVDRDAEISEVLQMPFSTVSGILKRIGMGRLGRLGMEPAERYERTVAGELIHIDVKKL